MAKIKPLDTRPKTVTIVGLGPSLREHLSENFRKGKLNHPGEIWAVNTGYRGLKCDKVFIMDDMRGSVTNNYPDWANELKTVKTPIITCKKYPEFPSAVEYPIEAVVNTFHSEFFSVTPAYMIAYAMLIQVETLYLFGIDFHYPNAVIAERGIGCVSHWLGRAEEHGVKYKIPESSTLMDANLTMVEKMPDGQQRARRLMYGYNYNPQDARRRVLAGDTDPLTVAISKSAYQAVNPYQDQQSEVVPK